MKSKCETAKKKEVTETKEGRSKKKIHHVGSGGKNSSPSTIVSSCLVMILDPGPELLSNWIIVFWGKRPKEERERGKNVRVFFCLVCF